MRNFQTKDASKRLEELGVKNVMLGGTRKVVEELKLLTSEQQIGQTGTAVNQLTANGNSTLSRLMNPYA